MTNHSKKYQIIVTYNFSKNQISLIKPFELTYETDSLYGHILNDTVISKRDEGNVKHVTDGLSVWKVTTKDKITSTQDELIEIIKDYLRAQVDEIEVC